MLIAWTTVGTGADADRLAADAVTAGLAACVQIDGPVVSHFRWEGKHERVEEFRLCFKLLPGQLDALRTLVLAAHPYDGPEWLVVRAEAVGEKYLSWAESTVHSRPL
jgi:periplasmic divalent cation tolerance protein